MQPAITCFQHLESRYLKDLVLILCCLPRVKGSAAASPQELGNPQFERNPG
jgi:hypothetical protein